jgi:hypothetical protein
VQNQTFDPGVSGGVLYDTQIEGWRKTNELGSDPEAALSDSAGQSGNAQGLSQIAAADQESVGELAETDRAYEAGSVDGLEDAANHPERSVHTGEDKGRN